MSLQHPFISEGPGTLWDQHTKAIHPAGLKSGSQVFLARPCFGGALTPLQSARTPTMRSLALILPWSVLPLPEIKALLFTVTETPSWQASVVHSSAGHQNSSAASNPGCRFHRHFSTLSKHLHQGTCYSILQHLNISQVPTGDILSHQDTKSQYPSCWPGQSCSPSGRGWSSSHPHLTAIYSDQSRLHLCSDCNQRKFSTSFFFFFFFFFNFKLR